MVKIKVATKINRKFVSTIPLIKGCWPQSYMGCETFIEYISSQNFKKLSFILLTIQGFPNMQNFKSEHYQHQISNT